ncbi:type III-B CRISPR module-associated Cmr3 family protein [Caenispirillum bisanense]|uniref:type III-B CRISPR module-associated Cmr3 family protein n=1 Tax=Caenispirillum bisanense TaxID=414052 RepID=UPI0031DA3C7E
MSTMTAVSFLIEPAEAVAFGPPKSSVAGEAHHIRSQFPPSPRTVQGLIRTRLLLGAEPRPDLGNLAAAPAIAALVGPPEALPEGWQLRGPFPAALVPAPPEVATDPDEAGQVLSPWVPAPRFLLGRGKHGDATRSRPMFVRRITSVAHPMLSDLGER